VTKVAITLSASSLNFSLVFIFHFHFVAQQYFRNPLNYNKYSWSHPQMTYWTALATTPVSSHSYVCSLLL